MSRGAPGAAAGGWRRRRRLLPALLLLVPVESPIAAERIPFVEDWTFQAADAAAGDTSRPPDRGWQPVRLPHDWSIGSAPSRQSATGGGGGFFPAGSGWYRKTFDAPEHWRGVDVGLYFEGVYRNAAVWLNGTRIAEHAYGYTPFRASLAAHLHWDRSNEIVVRVDNEPQPNSRWYTGSGIFRPVWLELRPPVGFEPESLFAETTRLTARQAGVTVSATVAAIGELQGDGRVEFRLFAPGGEEAASASVTLEKPEDQDTESVTATMHVANPLAWSPETPALYRLRASLWQSGRVLENSERTIGLRTLQWSAARGLEINGRPVELFGGNVHHDNGPLGAAAYREAEWRKARILRDAGFNAVRTAHNPPSEAFLDACDHLGLLVIDEAFDAWAVAKSDHDYAEIFEDNWAKDLEAMVLRDRNHPSVIMWSIGNEVYERGNASGVEIAHRMAAVIRVLDGSRPVTIGLNGLGEHDDWSRLDALFDAMGTAGYNYELTRHADDHARRPNRIVYASESYQNEAFANWKISSEHPYVIGDFVWSALDYLGESGIGRVFPANEPARPHWVGEHYPFHGALSGDIDITGARKPISHYRNIVWDRGEKLYAAVLVPPPDGRPWSLTKWSVPPARASWTWPGQEGRNVTLEVYSRYPDVAVYRDGKLVGRAPTGEAEAFLARFTLPYRPGRLEVVAGDESFVLESAQAPARLQFVDPGRLRLQPDRAIYFAAVEITDEQGTWHPAADRPVEVTVTGGELLAVGSGDLTSTEPYGANPRRSYEGRALLVFRVDPEAADVVLRAAADGLAPAVLRLR